MLLEELSLQDKASNCLKLLTRCRDAMHAGRWQRLAGLEHAYMAAFTQMRIGIDGAGTPVSEEYLPTIQKLEREQRHLIRFARHKQQVILDQLGVLDDVGKHLQRVQGVSRSIAGV